MFKHVKETIEAFKRMRKEESHQGPQTLEDFITEISSAWVTDIESMILNGDYNNLHAWIQPILMDYIKNHFTTDAEIRELYEQTINPSYVTPEEE